MRMREEECRARAEAARVARFATTGADLRPHLVPVTFAFVGAEIVLAIDQKPKSTTDLRRLRNLRENPHACLLWDHYDDDWTRLWWVRADCDATIAPDVPDWAAAAEALTSKYPQYRDDPPRGPVVVLTVAGWSGWAFASA